MAPGRRARAITSRGSAFRAVRDKTGHGIDLVGTIQAAANRGARIDSQGSLPLLPKDLRQKKLAGKESNLIVFVLDASGSMAAKDRLAAVTGAVTALLGDAYQRRDKVAVISVRGSAPTLVLPPTNSIDVARRRLEDLVVGGRTPLAQGLLMATSVIERELRRADGARRALMVVLSDGRATGSGGLALLDSVAADIAQRELAGTIVIDCERGGRIRLGLAAELAEKLHGVCVELDELSADEVVKVIDTY